MYSLKNKVVFITGASSGIGKALAKELTLLGANLFLCARRIERLEILKQELSSFGTKIIVLACDVTKEDDLDNAAARALKEMGSIDIVIANAGFGVSGNLEDLSLKDYRFQFETNVFGVLRTIYATLEALRKTKGSLVLIGSVAGYVGLPEASAYSMSKFSIHALAQALYHELRPHGITVTQISPGFVESEIRQVDNEGRHHANTKDHTSQYFVMPAQKAARQIVKAIKKRKRVAVITVHGKIVVLFQRHFPWLVDFMISLFSIKNRPEPK
ncbi:MAG: SDR family NAD(P)-dependent oxidoreductase [Deltaproteobacteria bacterium]|nr:SDR family NAD(P)-dependent oxidoreductase [Deltaproteobacteria bacterium]